MPLHIDISEQRNLFMPRFLAKIQKTDSCWIWTGAKQNPRRSQPSPYGVMLVQSKPRYAMLAHRLSWTLHFGTIPEDMAVLHKCDNPPCVNPDHLFLGTQLDNMKDRSIKERQARGENARSVLTEAQVMQIKERRMSGENGILLAKEFGCGRETVYAISRGQSWRHLNSTKDTK